MFVLIIDGTAIAVTDADQAEAEALFASEDFREDLRGFTSGGKPVWDGSMDFVVRAATEEEEELFEDALYGEEDDDLDDEELADDGSDVDEDEDDFDDEDGYQVMFLVEVDQLSDEA